MFATSCRVFAVALQPTKKSEDDSVQRLSAESRSPSECSRNPARERYPGAAMKSRDTVLVCALPSDLTDQEVFRHFFPESGHFGSRYFNSKLHWHMGEHVFLSAMEYHTKHLWFFPKSDLIGMLESSEKLFCTLGKCFLKVTREIQIIVSQMSLWKYLKRDSRFECTTDCSAAPDCWGFSLVYVRDEHVRILTSGLRDGLRLDEVNWSRKGKRLHSASILKFWWFCFW